MKYLPEYVEVPSVPEEDGNDEFSTWLDGKYVFLNEGEYLQIFLGHRSEEGVLNEHGNPRVEAMRIRVRASAGREEIINAAEMSAYGLYSAMDVASFTASLARKSRENPDDPEVIEHDDFISWVKGELDKLEI